MKDFILLLVILMCIVGLGMWQISYLEESSRYLKTDLNYAEYYIDLEKYEEAEKSMLLIENTWNNLKDTWGLFIHHDDIEYIDVSISEIKSYVKDMSKEDAKASIQKLISNISYTVDCEKVRFENVF